MDIREKLVELLKVPIYPHLDADPAEVVADYLLDNGVTVQEWRPVSELPKEDGRYFVARYDYVTKTTFADILWFERGRWWNRLHGGNYAVTHWMPMPPAPKGE